MAEPFVPRRVPGGYFKPHPETVWPAPDGIDSLNRTPSGISATDGNGKLVFHLLGSGWDAYVNLLTHPCGVEMLKSARRGWKALVREERGRA